MADYLCRVGGRIGSQCKGAGVQAWWLGHRGSLVGVCVEAIRQNSRPPPTSWCVQRVGMTGPPPVDLGTDDGVGGAHTNRAVALFGIGARHATARFFPVCATRGEKSPCTIPNRSCLDDGARRRPERSWIERFGGVGTGPKSNWCVMVRHATVAPTHRRQLHFHGVPSAHFDASAINP
jgi:hypothetical protein